MTSPYLYEFLYRGRPEGSDDPPTWHAIIGQHVRLPGAAEPQFISSGALTPEQAETAGFPLSAILDGINAAALDRHDAAVAEAAAARQERDAAVAERDAMAAQIAAMAAQIAAMTPPQPAEPATDASAA